MEINTDGSFGEVLKELRNRKRLSRPKLALQIHMSSSSIEKWERGDVLPDRARVEDLIYALGLSEAERLLLLEAHAGHRILPSVHNLPANRNAYFTGRAEILARLHDRLAPHSQVALTQAISGLGGIGKTQVALEYVYRYQKYHSHLLWVTADSREKLTAEFSKLAHDLDLPEKNEKDQSKAVQAVQRWMREYLDWVLILDNVEDLALVREFVPAEHLGAVLLTTRQHVTETVAQAIELKVFVEEEGALFLLRRAGRLGLDELPGEAATEVNIARAITQQLGGLPLALDQAGAYIAETGCSLSHYLNLLKRRQSALLQRRGSVPSDHPQSVTTTFSLAFEQLQQKNEVAIELLKLCAYLAPDAIPLEIIVQGSAHLGARLEPVASDAYLLDQLLEALLAYSLVLRDGESRILSIHRLVQAVVKDELEEADKDAWTERVVLAVNAVFPHVEHATWPQCERLLPHALLVAQYIETNRIGSIEAGRLLSEVASYLSDRARYQEAEQFFQRSLRIQEQILGSEHLDAAISLNGLATVYKEQGNYAEAERLYQRALPIFEKRLGPEHSHVGRVLHNLGTISYHHGNHTEAEQFYQRALSVFEKQPGSEHSYVATTLSNLAELYRGQGKYEQAEHLYQRALSLWEQQSGPEHPHAANTFNNLAVLYKDQGRYKEAEHCYQRALSIWEQSLGPEHPQTAIALYGLAELFHIQNDYKKAEQFYQRVMPIWEQRLGPEHPHMAALFTNLAELYQAQGNYVEAEHLHQRALPIFEKWLGPEHPHVAASLDGLARLFYQQKKYGEAEPLCQRALDIRERTQGSQGPETAESIHNLAQLRKAQGYPGEAIALYFRALEIRERVLGGHNLRTKETRADLIILLHTMGRHEEARQYEKVQSEQGSEKKEQEAPLEG